jgi:hypothetical protein
VVLDCQGTPTYRPYNGTPSRRFTLKMLTSLKEGDTLYLPAGSAVTVSQLSSGKRFQLKGPLELVLAPGGIQPGPGVTWVAAPPDRQAVIAGSGVDLSKLGGVTSRSSGAQVYVQEANPDLDVDLVPDQFETSTLQVRWRAAHSNNAWTTAKGTLVHVAGRRDRLRLAGIHLDESVPYVVYWGDKAQPTDDDAQFTILRIPEEKLKGIKELDRSAQGLAERLEVVEGYRNLRLFGRAEEILLALQQKYPTEANWNLVWEEFNEQRKRR